LFFFKITFFFNFPIFFFIFFHFFFKIIFLDFTFKILTWLKFLLCNFFLENTVDCCNVFQHSFSILFLYFSKLYFLIFFNMELIENLVL
jgi:hypothetical protein